MKVEKNGRESGVGSLVICLFFRRVVCWPFVSVVLLPLGMNAACSVSHASCRRHELEQAERVSSMTSGQGRM